MNPELVEPGPASAPRQTLGKYRLLVELGRGGMARVFLAAAPGARGLGKLVVLKLLLPELLREPEALAMFLDEARLATQLSHPNVVQTYEIGTHGERPAIVMEYLDGQPLSAVLDACRIAGRSLPVGLHLRVISSVLEGLHYVHDSRGYDGAELSLVHRDVSPHNVFVCYDGQVKLLDFGIAKVNTSSIETTSALLRGKIAYMPPEQMHGAELDRRADIYAVGCMLWELAAGSKLWKDEPNTSIFKNVINGHVPSPRSVNPSCDGELERIVMKALASDPGARYASASELHDVLEHYAARFGRFRARDVGEFVAHLFAEPRAELKAKLESQLARLDGEADYSASRNDVSLLPTDLTNAADVSRTTDGVPPSAALRPRRAAWPLMLGLVLAALGGVGWAVTKPAQSAFVQGPAAADPAPGAGPQLASARLLVEVSPPESDLLLDGRVAGKGRLSTQLARDGALHRLTARADGYVESTREFSVAEDLNLTVVLTKRAPPPSELAPSATRPAKKDQHAPGRSSTPQVEGPAPSSNEEVDCSQAFFIDATGTRRVRRECLK